MVLDRSIAPPFGAINRDFKIQQPEARQLDNGIPMYILLAGVQPIIRLEVIFDAGAWKQSTLGASYFATKMLSAGTKQYTSKEIEQLVAFNGAFLDLESNADRNTITLYCLSKHLKELLPVFVDITAGGAIFPEHELENIKNITKQSLAVKQNKTSYIASIKFKEALFNNQHPYGRSLSDSIINSISQEELLDFQITLLSRTNCTIILSGNGDEDFYNLINQYFGTISWGSPVSPTQTHSFSYIPQKKVIEKEQSIQSSIRIGKPLFTIQHPDYLKLSVLVEVLGGYFGSRLMKNIREDKGYTYGIHSNLVSQQHEGYLVIGTDVNKENTANTLKEIYYEIEQLKSEKISSDELNTVKNYLTGSFMNSLNTPFALADRFKSIHFNQLDTNFFNSYLEIINNIESEELLNLANTYFQLDELTEIVVGGK